MANNSDKAAKIANSPEFKQRVFFLCQFRARQAQKDADPQVALWIDAYKKITDSEKPGNLMRCAAAILIEPSVLSKVTDSNQGNEANDSTDLYPLVRDNMLAYADLCE